MSNGEQIEMFGGEYTGHKRALADGGSDDEKKGLYDVSPGAYKKAGTLETLRSLSRGPSKPPSPLIGDTERQFQFFLESNRLGFSPGDENDLEGKRYLLRTIMGLESLSVLTGKKDSFGMESVPLNDCSGDRIQTAFYHTYSAAKEVVMKYQ